MTRVKKSRTFSLKCFETDPCYIMLSTVLSSATLLALTSLAFGRMVIISSFEARSGIGAFSLSVLFFFLSPLICEMTDINEILATG